MLCYRRSNGYGDIDINADCFQLGRRLYEAQVALAQLRKAREEGRPLTDAEVDALATAAREFCALVAQVGQLRADYDTMRDCAEGKAEFIDDRVRYEG